VSRQASVTATVAAPAEAVFDLVTNIDRLPEWNANMTAVVEWPANVAAGAEWAVEFAAFGQKWRSRSRVEKVDCGGRVFAYRSATDDSNPSYTRWRWQVEEDGLGSRVMVSWDLNPATFWRKVLLARVRHRQLRRADVPASLEALAGAVASTP
jgi:uncharacterized protein YndB with AHSA1/START domain